MELAQNRGARTTAYLNDLLPLKDIARFIPSSRAGRPTNTATIFRWITSGTKAANGEVVRLQAVRMGNRWLTSRQWLTDYADRLTRAFEGDEGRSVPARTRQAERATAELDALGF